MEWKAKWIWDDGEERPRNYYLCFRKRIYINKKIKSALLHITADSRYLLYINGRLAGHGPVRCWPHEQSFDTYDVLNELIEGKNVIAVMVSHFGISTFQYIEGRGGLLVQLDLTDCNNSLLCFGTDGSWKNKPHDGYERNSVRVSCQQPWVEMYEASLFSDGWKDIGYDDCSWSPVRVIGDAGMDPWGNPVRRDIPFLREDIVYPERVESAALVMPEGENISIDLRPVFFPGDYDANPKNFLGYLCTVIQSPERVNAIIHLSMPGSYGWPEVININGKVYSFKSEDCAEVKLQKGSNLFLIDISGCYHELFVHMNIECSCTLSFNIPGCGKRFALLGPFEQKTVLKTGKAMDNSVDLKNEVYRSAVKCSTWQDILNYWEWLKPVNENYVCSRNIYNLFTCKKIIERREVAGSLKNMAIPNESYSLIEPERNGDTEITLDFGREVSGYIEFDIDAPDGAVLDFYGVEYIKDGVPQDTEDLKNTMRYISRFGRQVYRSILRRGFRFIVIGFRNLTAPVKVYRINTIMSTYPAEDTGRFFCSDFEMNRIWEISRDTTRLCMEDTFVDCPAYEQTFWVGDFRNEALVSYYAFGSYALAKRSLNLVAGSLKRTEIPESQVPSGWQNVLVAWGLFWMSACREYFDFTGDVEFIENMLPVLLSAARGFEKHINPTGLLDIQAWNMLEWAPMDTPDKGIVTHQNAELVKALMDCAYIAGRLQKDKEKAYFEGIAGKVKDAINKYLWSEEKKAFFDCIHENGTPSPVISMQTNIIALLCGCAGGSREEILKKYLYDTPDYFVKIGSPFMSFFYLEAMFKAGMALEAYKYIRCRWGDMLRHGATTCYETFPGYNKKFITRSHCHAWSAAPGYFLGAYILGIRPAAEGFKKVRVDINPCGLSWANGSVPTPFGRIDVEWEKVPGGLIINIRGPEVQYIFEKQMAGTDVCSISINGKQAKF